jgi:ATP-binding cassette subfamily B (MDR/TAP) protein 1
MQDGSVVQQGFRRDLTHGVFAAMAAEQSAAPLQPKLDFSWRAPEAEAEEEEDLDELARMHTTTFRMSMRPTPTPKRQRPRSMSLSRPRTSSVNKAPERWRASTQSLPHVAKHAGVSLTHIPLKLRRSGEHARSADLRRSTDRRSIEKDELDAPHPHPQRRSSLAWQAPEPELKVYGFFRLMWRFLPGIPHRGVLLLGTLASVGRGVATPVWSFFLAQLMALLGVGSNGAVAAKSGILIGIIVAQGLVVFAQHASLASLGAVWTAQLRSRSYGLVLAQDKTWFDREDNSPPRLVQGLIKDVDDMRHLVATVLPRIIVATFMVGLGFIWAMAVGWQLTLVGLGLLPVFAVIGVTSTVLLSCAEVYNKARREAVSRLFFEVSCSLIRLTPGRRQRARHPRHGPRTELYAALRRRVGRGAPARPARDLDDRHRHEHQHGHAAVRAGPPQLRRRSLHPQRHHGPRRHAQGVHPRALQRDVCRLAPRLQCVPSLAN